MPRLSPYTAMGFPNRPLHRATGSSSTYPLANASVKPPPSPPPPPPDYAPSPDYMPLVPGGEGPRPPEDSFATFMNMIPQTPTSTGPLPAGTVYPPNAQRPNPPVPQPTAPPQSAAPSTGPAIGQTMNNGNGLIYTWNGSDWKPDQAAFTQYQQQQAAQFGTSPSQPTPGPQAPTPGFFGGIMNAAINGMGSAANGLTQLTNNANQLPPSPPNRPFSRFVPPPSPPPYPMPRPGHTNYQSLAGR